VALFGMALAAAGVYFGRRKRPAIAN